MPPAEMTERNLWCRHCVQHTVHRLTRAARAALASNAAIMKVATSWICKVCQQP